MKIGIVSYRCENRDMQLNIGQIERAMKEAYGKADLLCFISAGLSNNVANNHYRNTLFCGIMAESAVTVIELNITAGRTNRNVA